MVRLVPGVLRPLVGGHVHRHARDPVRRQRRRRPLEASEDYHPDRRRLRGKCGGDVHRSSVLRPRFVVSSTPPFFFFNEVRVAEPEFPGQFVMSLSVVLYDQVDKSEVDVGLCFRSTRVQRTKAERPVYLPVIRCYDATALQLNRIDFGT